MRMRERKDLYGLLNIKETYCYGTLFLLMLCLTSCKSHRLLIDINEVENVNFWFIGDVDTTHAIEDCLDIVYAQDNHKIIVRDRKNIERFIAIINRSKPINPGSNYDLRVSSLVRQKTINGKRGPDIKVCIGNYGRRVLINGVLMKGDHEQLQKFIQEVLYDSLTPYEWLPGFMKEYIEQHPEERSKFLPDE